MNDAVLVDTNVLVYFLDSSERLRHLRAIECLGGLGKARTRTSTQTLAELANVMIHARKLAQPPSRAAEAVQDFERAGRVLTVDARTVIAALGACERWQLEYYDAQIWATAQLNGVPTVLSEDFSHGQTLGDVTFINPFADDFDLATL
jgi:predicted nucleic acid-binding protein